MSSKQEAEAAVVQAFNNLSRDKLTPSGLLNHWHFTIRHVDLDPPGDLVHLVHPFSNFIHCAGPTQILSLPSAAAKADVIVPLLLDSFIQGIAISPNEKPMEAFAPFTWATGDPELVKAIEKRLEEVGVTEELCMVHEGTKEQQDISDATWAGFMDSLKKRASGSENDTTVCATCRKDKSTLPNPLKKCSGCGGPRYCSRECQKADWKQHKKFCKTPNASQQASTESKMLDPVDYYHKVAHGVPQAQALARSLYLKLPTEQGRVEGLVKPIRRLVITGKDTAENLAILLGPKWKDNQGSIHEDMRIHALLNPPPGSPSYKLYSQLDEGLPSRSPRPANDAEKEKLQRVRDMQAAIKSHLGSRKEPTVQDMQAVLAGMGQDWDTSLPIYQLAVNTMDQGV